MEYVYLKTITNNCDNKRIPLNALQRSKKESQPLYPYIGANNIMGYIDDYIFNEKILCVAEDGGNWGYKQVCAKIYTGKVWVNNHAHVLTAKDGLILEYLMYYLNYEDLSLFINGATRGKLTKSSLNKLKIPLPPLAEQKRIANILDHADQLRQLNQQILAEYDVLTKSLFLDMFGDPVANPMGWEEVLFTDILILRRGFDLPKQNRVKGIYPIMASNGILDWHNEYKVNGPGIVTGRSGTLGKVHYVKSDYWPLNTALYSLDLKGNNPTYLLYLIKNFRIDRFARGAGVPTLNRNLVHAEKIIKVPTQLQNQFAQKIKNIEAQKAKAQAALAASEDLFNHLLQKAFKGEL